MTQIHTIPVSQPKATLPTYSHSHQQNVCRYKIVKQLGDGTYGSVWKGMNHQTNEVVCHRLLSPTLVDSQNGPPVPLAL